MKKFFIISAIAMIAILSGCSQPASSKAPEEAKKAKIVEVIKVTEQHQSLLLTKSGVVEAKQETKLAFGTSGKIINLPVKKGMQVKKGEVLGVLDTSSYQSLLALSTAQINEAQVKRAKILKGDVKIIDTYDSSIKQTEDSIANTEDAIKKQKIKINNELKKAAQNKAELERNEILFMSGAIPKVDIDNLKAKIEQDELNIKSEQAQLTALEGQKERQVEQKQLTLKQKQKAVAADKDNGDRLASTDTEIASAKNGIVQANKGIQDARIVAPFSGVVVDVLSHPGDIISQGSPVVTLVDLSQVRVKVEMEPALIPQVAPDEMMTVIREDGTRTQGTVSFISPLADAETGKYNVEITVPNPNGAWRGGMLAAAELPRKLSAGVILPLQCVGVGEKGSYVLVVENGLVRKRGVETGQMAGDKIEILSGIHPGALVITSGISFLIEGEKVTPKESKDGENY